MHTSFEQLPLSIVHRTFQYIIIETAFKETVTIVTFVVRHLSAIKTLAITLRLR